MSTIPHGLTHPEAAHLRALLEDAAPHTPHDLLQQAAAHVESLAHRAHSNAMIDLPLARAIHRALHGLVANWDTVPQPLRP